MANKIVFKITSEGLIPEFYVYGKRVQVPHFDGKNVETEILDDRPSDPDAPDWGALEFKLGKAMVGERHLELVVNNDSCG
jgi:hypothetical protein